MAGKAKFQISRSQDERIKQMVDNVHDFEPEFEGISEAYILGFHYSNTTNYVGLTTDFILHHAGYPVVGLVFFTTNPEDSEVQTKLKSVKEHYKSVGGLPSFKADKNEHLFLIYTFDTEAKQIMRKIFDSLSGSFLEEQPKLSVLDDNKLFSHSSLIEVKFPIKLELYENSNVLASKDKIKTTLEDAKKSLSNDTTKVKVHLMKSSFSTNSITGNKNATESLYDYLEPPSDITQMGDYLPNLSKVEKQKMIDKWRNKIKSQRSPLQIELEHDELSFNGEESSKFHVVSLSMFLHIHVNDSITKSLQIILYTVRNHLDVLRYLLVENEIKPTGKNELKSCVFKPQVCNHLIPAIYPIPDKETPDYKKLETLRRHLHKAYLIPMSQPQFRYIQRVRNSSLKNVDEEAGYLSNVHLGILENSGIKNGARAVIKGTYTYHHYLQDRATDSGWGCAYRSLQTIISWFKHQGYIYSPDVPLRGPNNDKVDKTSELRRKLSLESRVPSHEEIQSVLVDVGDKEASFIGSQKWIGSQEVCYVLNHLYNLDSKFITVNSGSELVYKARELTQHLASQSTPIMIGGGVLAHTIIGVDFNEKNGDVSYLILDPHYTGPEDLSTITKKGWCAWKKNSFWDKNAFYNLCLPQKPNEF